MLVHAYYDEDPRVRREAESLVAAGRPVDVFGLRRDGDAPHGVLDGVTVHRLDVRRHQGAGLGTYLFEYLAFLVRGPARALLQHRELQIGSLVQGSQTLDFGMRDGGHDRLLGRGGGPRWDAHPPIMGRVRAGSRSAMFGNVRDRVSATASEPM